MDRRRAALYLLLAFVVCTGIAILVDGTRPGQAGGQIPIAIQTVGYAAGLVAGLLLTRPEPAEGRRTIAVLLAAFVVLVLLDVLVLRGSEGGTNIGAGLVRLAGLVLIGLSTARIARELAAERRPR